MAPTGDNPVIKVIAVCATAVVRINTNASVTSPRERFYREGESRAVVRASKIHEDAYGAAVTGAWHSIAANRSPIGPMCIRLKSGREQLCLCEAWTCKYENKQKSFHSFPLTNIIIIFIII